MGSVSNWLTCGIFCIDVSPFFLLQWVCSWVMSQLWGQLVHTPDADSVVPHCEALGRCRSVRSTACCVPKFCWVTCTPTAGSSVVSAVSDCKGTNGPSFWSHSQPLAARNMRCLFDMLSNTAWMNCSLVFCVVHVIILKWLHVCNIRRLPVICGMC